MKKFLISFALIMIALTINSAIVHAGAAPIDTSLRPENIPFSLDYSKDANTNTITVLNIIAGALLYFAVPGAILVIIYGSFQMLMGQGDPDKIDEGKKTVTWSAAGLLLMILSYSIVRIVLDITIKAGEAAA